MALIEAFKHQLRRASASKWLEQDPVLRDGEPAFDKTKKILKIGDGVKKWSKLGGLGMRKDFAGNLTTEDPVLGDGEPCWDKTNKLMKVGDGTSKWSELKYFFGKTLQEWTDLFAHYVRTDNPHSVTAAQAGAVALDGSGDPAVFYKEKIKRDADPAAIDLNDGGQQHIALPTGITAITLPPVVEGLAFTLYLSGAGVGAFATWTANSENGGGPAWPDDSTEPDFAFSGANRQHTVSFVGTYHKATDKVRWFGYVGGKGF